jgi:hypothetical protein
MSPDRLAELRRQRALVAQHLAWLDSELAAAETGKAPAPSPASPPASVVPAAPVDNETPSASSASNATPEPDLDPAVALANARADEIIERYRATEAYDPATAKRGCLVLVGALFALGGAVILAIYYFGYANR